MIPELSVVLPVHNQADHIGAVMTAWTRATRGRKWEFILVPNGCRDDSAQVCRQVARKEGRVRVVESVRGGWGLGVRLGLKAARGKFLCYTNSARTEPAVVLHLFEVLRRDPKALVKARRVQREAPLRKMGSFLYNLECAMLLGIHSPDVNGTPKLLSAANYRRLDLREDGDLLDAEVLSQCRAWGIRVAEVPWKGWERHGGSSTTRWKSALRMYRGVFRLWKGKA